MKTIYIRTKCSDGFEIRLDKLKPYDLLFTLSELEDEWKDPLSIPHSPCFLRINEIVFRAEEIDDLINGLLKAKWEYINEHGQG